MRIVTVTPNLPWPLDTGGNVAQFTTLKCLSQDHDFVLVAPVYSAIGSRNADTLRTLLPRVTVRAVICQNHNLLEATARMAATLGRRAFERLKSRSSHTPFDFFYNPFKPLPQALIETIGSEIADHCDLLQAEFMEMLQLGPWIPREIPKLFVHHQLQSVYTSRAIDAAGGFAYLNYWASAVRTQEAAFLKEFDGIVTFSEADRSALLSFLPPDKVHSSPFPTPADVPIATVPSVNWNGRFAFIASEMHAPNVDGLQWFLSEVWPLIVSRNPAATTHVVGRWRPRTVRRLSSRNIHFHGFVPHLEEVISDAIVVVPLRVGSGIRVKILAAMACGVPVLSTSIGAEGLPVVDGENIVIGDNPEQLAAAAISLASNVDLRRRIASGGLLMVKDHFSPESVRKTRNQIYQNVVASVRNRQSIFNR